MMKNREMKMIKLETQRECVKLSCLLAEDKNIHELDILA